MKPKQILCWILPAIILFACNSNSNKEALAVADVKMEQLPDANYVVEPPKADKQKIPVGTQKENDADTATQSITAKPAANTDWDKKIIKTAALRLEVKDFKKCSDAVHQTVKQFGGYIAQEEQNTSDFKLETTVTLKVPVEQFDNLMNGLAGTDAKVIERKITTEDVTGEVVDVKSRLEAKKQMRLKYLDFLKQSKNMEEALQVQSEINSLQEEIEAAAGRVNYLSHSAAMSTILLTFYQPLAGFEPGTENPSFLTRTTEAFKAGAKWFADVFVGLISIWPLVLLICAAILILKRKNSAKAKTA